MTELNDATVAAWLRQRARQLIAAADIIDGRNSLSTPISPSGNTHHASTNGTTLIDRIAHELGGKKRRPSEIAERLGVRVAEVEAAATEEHGFTRSVNGWIEYTPTQGDRTPPKDDWDEDL